MSKEEMLSAIQEAVQNAIQNTPSGVNIALVISIVALIVSALSPVISSIISGKYQIKVAIIEAEEELKRKQLEIETEAMRRSHEFFEQHRAEVIERYINSVGKTIQNFAAGNREGFGESMGEIYMYVDQSLWPLLDSIAKKFDRRNPGDPSAELRELCQKLSGDGIRTKYKGHPDAAQE